MCVCACHVSHVYAKIRYFKTTELSCFYQQDIQVVEFVRFVLYSIDGKFFKLVEAISNILNI